MILVNIGEKEYRIKNEWQDYTLRDAIDVYKAISNAPKTMQELYKATTQEELDEIEITSEEMARAFPKWYGEMITLCSDIPEDVMKKVYTPDRTIIFKSYLDAIVKGLVHYPEDIEMITEFEWEGVVYKLPESRTILGEEQLGDNTIALQWTEVSDLEYFTQGLEGGKYEFAANIISILCLPEGEEYDEDVSLKRSEMFMDLPMNIVHGVFFSTLDYINKCNQRMIRSLAEDLRESQILNQLHYQSLVGTDQFLA